jgi:nuclear protein localization family protein 4
VTEFEPEFLLVKIAHGSSRSNKFAIVKKADFPPLIRDRPTKKDMKEYMKKNKNIKQSWLKYGDFNFLLYLAQ